MAKKPAAPAPAKKPLIQQKPPAKPSKELVKTLQTTARRNAIKSLKGK